MVSTVNSKDVSLSIETLRGKKGILRPLSIRCDVMPWAKALEPLLPVFRRLGISGTSVAPGKDGCIMTRPHSLSYLLMMTTTTWTTRMINVALVMYQSLGMDDVWCEYADDGRWMMCDLNISIIFLSFLTHGLIFPCCPALVHCCTLSLCHLGSDFWEII